jgi:hypothetical protein
MGYKAISFDEKFLDPKYVFEDIPGQVGSGEIQDPSQKISSLKRLIDNKKAKAKGYDDEDLARNLLYNEADLSDFFKSIDPYEFLTKFNKFNIDNEAAQFMKDHDKLMKVPSDL